MSGAPVPVCASDDLQVRQAVCVDLDNDSQGHPQTAIVVRDETGQVRAYLNRCRHLPIPLDGGSGRVMSHDGRHLVCLTHGATYRLRDGHCERGPCRGAALLPLRVIERDGQLFVAH